MRQGPYTDLTHRHHTARWFPTLKRWVIVNQARGPVAVVTTTTTNHATRLAVTLLLGEYKLPLDPFVRPGGMRTALRWVCRELNNSNLWLGARLLLEREARLLDYSESEILAHWHGHDYKCCLQLLANLPGLLDWY